MTMVFTYKSPPTSIDAPWVQVVPPITVSSQAIDFLVIWQVIFAVLIILISCLNSCLLLSSEADDTVMQYPLLELQPEISPEVRKSMKERLFGQLQREITQRISNYRKQNLRLASTNSMDHEINSVGTRQVSTTSAGSVSGNFTSRTFHLEGAEVMDQLSEILARRLEKVGRK